MSFLHIMHNGKKATIHIDDGKSDLLDRYVDVDTGYMYYTMGKQIGGKPINPNGKIGKEIMRIAQYWVNNPDTRWSPQLFGGGKSSACFIATAAYGYPFAPEINTLCNVRDMILRKSRVGKLSVNIYYMISLPISRLVAKTTLFASVIRHIISGMHKYCLMLLRWHCHKTKHFERLDH